MSNLRYPVLIFDWDGTLRDSIAAIVSCAQAALEGLGLPTADAETVRGTIGLGLDTAIPRWCPGADARTRNEIQASYARLWIADWHARADCFPGVVDSLHRLTGAGHTLAIATGKSRVGLDRDFTFGDARAIRTLFAASRTADETTPKPSPQMVLELLDELDAHPDEALVIGDSEHDLEMAAQAGCPALGVTTGALGRSELQRHGAIAVVDQIPELEHWLSSVNATTTTTTTTRRGTTS